MKWGGRAIPRLRRNPVPVTLDPMSSSTHSAPRQRQEELGQFLTPAPVAAFMASLLGALPETVRLLDAGAGAGALTTGFISRVIDMDQNVRTVEATLYEVDPVIRPALLRTMQICRSRCAEAGIRFSFTIHETDFIMEMSNRIGDILFGEVPPAFDVAIANPPYRKISIDSPERRSLRHAGIETSNLYTAFIALIHRLLAQDGQLVAITPRSFCNGPYFRDFREDLLKSMALRRLHVFESRGAAFREDSVLQENIIFYAVKGRKQPARLMVSSSSGKEVGTVTGRMTPYAEVVRPGDPARFIHIPSGAEHTIAKRAMDRLHSSLASLGVQVSTGPVVDFRLKNAVRMEPGEGTVPLIYPCHFNGGTVHWPKRNSRKPNAILDNEETRPWLVRSGVYLLTKRFTSKEERRRLVACVFDPEEVEGERIGLENHINYFHANGCGLDRNLAYGLYAFLNSTVVDQYFRRFSGHTQVNATDLRALSYPDRRTLQTLGRGLNKLDLTQDEIDRLVEDSIRGCGAESDLCQLYASSRLGGDWPNQPSRSGVGCGYTKPGCLEVPLSPNMGRRREDSFCAANLCAGAHGTALP